MSRLFVVVSAFSALLYGSAQPAPSVERALHKRVDEFYKLVVAHRYRDVEKLVAPESRDDWYTLEKPSIKEFEIEGTAWSDNFTKADVSISSTSRMRRPRIGEFDVKVPFASHWKLENGRWMWYVPRVDVRQTPFGPMHVNHGEAEKSGLDIHQMIAKGPSPNAVSRAVTADRSSVKLPPSGDAVVALTNTLPGDVKLSVKLLAGAGFDVALKASDLKAGAKTELAISHKKDVDFQPGRAAVVVSPTSQVLEIAVQ